MKWYLEVLKKYAVFQGRSRRSEFWYFVLIDIIIAVILSVIGIYLQTEVIYNMYAIAVLVPSIAVAVRRMHDTGKSGWFILIPFYNLVLYCRDGTQGPNQYGSDPKRPEFDEFLQDAGSGQAV